MTKEIDWSKQISGVHQAPINVLLQEMPDLTGLIETFPDRAHDFTWDVKVHMLMPRQYPCIPNWHTDNVPRKNGIQQFDRVRPELPMYLWLSGPPLTQFKHGYVSPMVWHRFTQLDEHRGTPAASFVWRGFIRATHRDIQPPKSGEWVRRHSQVYLDAETCSGYKQAAEEANATAKEVIETITQLFVDQKGALVAELRAAREEFAYIEEQWGHGKTGLTRLDAFLQLLESTRRVRRGE